MLNRTSATRRTKAMLLPIDLSTSHSRSASRSNTKAMAHPATAWKKPEPRSNPPPHALLPDCRHNPKPPIVSATIDPRGAVYGGTVANFGTKKWNSTAVASNPVVIIVSRPTKNSVGTHIPLMHLLALLHGLHVCEVLFHCGCVSNGSAHAHPSFVGDEPLGHSAITHFPS